MIIDATLTEDDLALKERIAWCVSGGYDWVPSGDSWEHVDMGFIAPWKLSNIKMETNCGRGEILTSSYTNNYNTVCTVTVGEDGEWQWFTEPCNEFEL